jgi:hypothetical protein
MYNSEWGKLDKPIRNYFSDNRKCVAKKSPFIKKKENRLISLLAHLPF